MEWNIASPASIEAGQLDSAIDVWRLDLEELAPHEDRFAELLSPTEWERASRFVRSEDRRRFSICRGALRTLLANYLQTEPRSIALEVAPHGKPYLAKLQNKKEIEFNLSHSGELALAAFGRGGPIGVDLERIRLDVDELDLADRYFSLAEIVELRELQNSFRRLGFFNCWTRKEAYVKAHGEGLSIPLASFSVSLAPGQAAKLLAPDSATWRIFQIAPGQGFTGAVVTQANPSALSLWNYSLQRP
ncbi:MAG TPA: 4'-phosphopantetheinyl transferase superfamily protein [Dongiaceae bacterium]|nr:4'-phosphopantetheinyl transferase superfamily protein [Dongiaceae bacterium]